MEPHPLAFTTFSDPHPLTMGWTQGLMTAHQNMAQVMGVAFLVG